MFFKETGLRHQSWSRIEVSASVSTLYIKAKGTKLSLQSQGYSVACNLRDPKFWTNRKEQTQQKLPFPIHDTDLLGAFPSCRGAQVPFPLYSAVQCIGLVAYCLRESSVFSSTYRLPCQSPGDRHSCDRLFPQAPWLPWVPFGTFSLLQRPGWSFSPKLKAPGHIRAEQPRQSRSWHQQKLFAPRGKHSPGSVQGISPSLLCYKRSYCRDTNHSEMA